MALLLLVGWALAGCGTGTSEGTQPAPGVSTFEQGRFDDLPLPSEAEPVGPRSEEGGIVARSFEVPDLVPTDVIEFYEEALGEQGWTVVRIEDLPQGMRGDWSRDGHELRVSANEAPGLDAPGSQPGTQLSLVLSPRRSVAASLSRNRSGSPDWPHARTSIATARRPCPNRSAY